MPEFAVEAHELTKVYPDGKVALDSFEIQVSRGAVHSLLGRNGAGKTTFTRIISTILEPTSGRATVLGYDVMSQPGEIRKRIAIVPQEARPFSLQTPFEHVFMYLVSRGESFSQAREKTTSVISDLGLSEYAHKICGNLSGGLRQKVIVAMAIATEPELILLDEPTIGLDPVARMDIWNVIRNIVKENRTVFLTTHYMDEAEVLSDTISIMDRGKKVREGPPKDLRRDMGYTTTVVVSGELDVSNGWGEIYRHGSTIRVFTDAGRAEELVRYATRNGIGVAVRPLSIEDVFLKLVGEMDD